MSALDKSWLDYRDAASHLRRPSAVRKCQGKDQRLFTLKSWSGAAMGLIVLPANVRRRHSGGPSDAQPLRNLKGSSIGADPDARVLSHSALDNPAARNNPWRQ